MQSRFDILHPVARSHFSSVDHVCDHQLGIEVALKRPLIEHPHWQREAIAFDHLPTYPHLIQRLEESSDEQGPFRILEWINGAPLQACVEKDALDELHAIHLIRQVLTALAVIHDTDFIHADLSPANVILSNDDRVKLIDFGNAHRPGQSLIGLTGSIHSMAPELFDGKSPSIASDLYAVGVIAWHSLTQSHPFEGETKPQIITAHHRHLLTPLPIDCAASPLLIQWIKSLLARDPSLRPASAREALNSLPHG